MRVTACRSWSSHPERVTNIAMGTEIDNIIEFEDVLDIALDETPVGREMLLPV